MRNDELDWSELVGGGWDRIVISPGPGPAGARARHRRRAATRSRRTRSPCSASASAIRASRTCAAARVVRGQHVVHGRISPVFHRGDGLFSGIPQGFRAVRYHSLVVEAALPPELEAIAWADDGTVMAIRARGERAWGVQFHPESVGTEHGERLIANFLALTPPRRRARRGRRRAPHDRRSSPAAGRRCAPTGAVHVEPPRARRRARRRGAPSPRCSASASTRSGWTRASSTRRSRASRSWAPRSARSARRSATASRAQRRDGHARRRDRGRTSETAVRLPRARARAPAHREPRAAVRPQRRLRRLPRLRAEGRLRRRAPRTAPSCPTRFLLLADRIVAFDHERGAGAPARAGAGGRAQGAAAARWLDDDRGARSRASPALCDRPRRPRARRPLPRSSSRRGREHYMANVEACKRLLEAGESYEICLTNRLALAPHRATRSSCTASLRRVQPGALRRLPADARRARCSAPRPSASCASAATARSRRSRSRAPAARNADPRADAAARDALLASAKDRAEHLMIVDLLRNDLGLVVADRQRLRRQAHGRRELRDRPPARLDDPRAAARRRRHRRLHPRDVPRRLDDRRAEAAHDGDHRRPRGRAARRLLGRARLPRAQRHGRPQHRHPHARRDRRAARRSAPAARSSCCPTPSDEYDEMLLKAQPLLDAVAISGSRGGARRAAAAPLSGR